MPKEYNDYGYWNAPYFLQKAAAVGTNTRILIENVIKKFAYPVQSFRSCFGILKFADRYGKKALEDCCTQAVQAGKCNYSYIANTITSFVDESPSITGEQTTAKCTNFDNSGIFKDDDSKYYLKNLMEKQNEGGPVW